MKMKTEDWQIEYDMQTPRGVVHVKEKLPCKWGYHQKLIKWYKQQDFEPSETAPLHKVRRGNYIELLLEFGRNLPLEERTELTDGELLASEKHPITLIAPDGTRYTCREF